MTLTLVAERLAVGLSQPVFITTDLCLSRPRFEHPTFCMWGERSNQLHHHRGLNEVRGLKIWHPTVSIEVLISSAICFDVNYGRIIGICGSFDALSRITYTLCFCSDSIESKTNIVNILCWLQRKYIHVVTWKAVFTHTHTHTPAPQKRGSALRRQVRRPWIRIRHPVKLQVLSTKTNC